jgi:hypothetical protein
MAEIESCPKMDPSLPFFFENVDYIFKAHMIMYIVNYNKHFIKNIFFYNFLM